MVKRTKARKKSRKRKSRKRQKGGCGCAMSGGGLLDLFNFKKNKDNLPGQYNPENQIGDEDLGRSMEEERIARANANLTGCLLYTSPSPRDLSTSRMPSSA